PGGGGHCPGSRRGRGADGRRRQPGRAGAVRRPGPWAPSRPAEQRRPRRRAGGRVAGADRRDHAGADGRGAGRAGRRPGPWPGGAEIPRLAEVFPTRLLDIRDHHLLLHGEDVFAGLEIDGKLLRLRVEQELSNLSLRLRRTLVTLAADPASAAAYLASTARPL